MNKALVLAEWKRATQSLGAAFLCRGEGFYEDSASRAYYAILHAAKAALQVHGVSAESHAAVKRRAGRCCGMAKPAWAKRGDYDKRDEVTAQQIRNPTTKEHI